MTKQGEHPLFGYTVSYRRAAELQARILASRLMGNSRRTSRWSPGSDLSWPGGGSSWTDIRDDRRLRAVATCMEGYGTQIQYSVFVCDLSDQEAVLMRSDLEFRMKQSEDSVMIVNLGRAGESSVPVLGHHERLPTSSAVIVLRRERSGSVAVAGERSHADRPAVFHLDKSIAVRQPAACAKPLAQRPVPAGQVARIL